MKERPILFSGPMVRAILESRKTQTRRIVKPQPVNIVPFIGANNKPTGEFGLCLTHERVIDKHVPCPFGQPGDRLWVRETWQVARETLDYETGGEYDVFEWDHELYGDPRQFLNGDARFGMIKAGLFYAADGDNHNPSVFYDVLGFDGKKLRSKEIAWRHSIHMPRWASRITLEITEVRIERLQDISEEDAIAEGIDGHLCAKHTTSSPSRNQLLPAAVHAYFGLFESLYGAGSWDDNPYVWCISFRRVEPYPSSKETVK